MLHHPKPVHYSKDQIVALLAERIANGDIPLHSQLPPERELCAQFGIGRSVRRSVLRELEAEGLIWRHVGKGTFVGNRPSSLLVTTNLVKRRGALHELLETRQLLEPVAARLAAQRAQPSDIGLLNRYQELAVRAGDWDEYLKWDELFHRVIVEITANTFIISMMDCLIKTRCSSRWSTVGMGKFSKALQDSFSEQHLEICQRIAAGDSVGAERAMSAHMGLISTEFGPMISAGKKSIQ